LGFCGGWLLYYANLTRARTQNDLNQWVRFFLVGVKETAEDAIDTFGRILALKSDIEATRIPKIGKRTALRLRLLTALYSRPVINAQQVALLLDVNHSTVSRLINVFVEQGILQEKTGFRRNRLFEFGTYLSLFDKRRG